MAKTGSALRTSTNWICQRVFSTMAPRASAPLEIARVGICSVSFGARLRGLRANVPDSRPRATCIVNQERDEGRVCNLADSSAMALRADSMAGA